jgi:homogentisate 1,2-dioxygenase
VGELATKRHSQFRGPDGQLYLEELVGQHGFFNALSLLYHWASPNVIVAAEAVEVAARWPTREPNLPLMPRYARSLPVAGVGTGEADTWRRDVRAD